MVVLLAFVSFVLFVVRRPGYAPVPRSTAGTVSSAIFRSSSSDQLSMY